MTAHHRHVVGDFSRILGAAFNHRSTQTEPHLLEATRADKGVEVRKGRKRSRPYELFMHNASQTDVQRHRYSVFVVVFLLVLALNVWFAYVSFNIHYKVFSPIKSTVISSFGWSSPFRIVKMFHNSFKMGSRR